MDNLTPITREEMLMNDEPLTPITREEKILAGEDLTPVTRREYFLKKYRHAGGDVMVEGLSVTENGTYTAPEGKAYSPVEVAVPMPENAYLLKEVSGSLVSFSDGADLPMPSFVCKIEAVQSGSGDPSPENVRPISGHTGVEAVISPTTEASAGTTYSVSWQTEAGEVFGGYIDLVSGEMRVTDGYIDLGTCEWLRTDLGNNNYRYYTTKISNLIKVPSSTSEMPNIECSHYKNKLPSQYNQAVDGITIYTNGSIQVYDSTKSALTTTDFKTAMDGVQLVYELATPITYQLTPTQIKSLLGTNNAWCSTGDVDIDYFAKEV